MAGSYGWQPEERNDGQEQGARRQSSRRRGEDTLAGQEPGDGKVDQARRQERQVHGPEGRRQAVQGRAQGEEGPLSTAARRVAKRLSAPVAITGALGVCL